MSKSENGYIGMIKNAGTQVVDAPCQHTEPKKGAKVKTGSDLRTRGK